MHSRRKTLAYLSFLLALAAGLWPLPAPAQKTSSEAARSKEDEAKDRAKVMEALQERYKVIGQFAGSWTGTCKAMIQDKPAREVSAPATLEARWGFEQKWLQSDMTLELGKEGGSFYITSFLGFNPGTQQYKRFLLTKGDPRDTLQTGTWDEATKTFVFQAPIINYFTNDSFDRRDTFKVLDADRFHYRLDYIFPDKSEILAIEGVFTRKK